MNSCPKCQGHLVKDYLMSSMGGGNYLPCLRCVNCGYHYYPKASPCSQPEGMTHEQIAAKLGCSRTYVIKLEQQAIRKLETRIRKFLKGEDPHEMFYS